MGLLELFILAVGLSMDAFAGSVCKGTCNAEISVKKAGIVGLWFGGFQALMPALGYLLAISSGIRSPPLTTGSHSSFLGSSEQT